MKFKEIKKVFVDIDEPKELEIVNRFHRNRIIAYSLYCFGVALLPTAEIGPGWFYSLAIGGLINIKNTKRKLYDQLKTYEKYHLVKPLKSKIDSTLTDSFLPSQKIPDSLFTISLMDFRRLDYKNIESKFNVNDTTHLIFKLFERTERNRNYFIGFSILYPIVGVIVYNGMTEGGINNEAKTYLIGIETFVAIGTAIFIPTAINSAKNAKRKYLYQSLQNYLNHHTLDYRTKRYITNHIENMKY